MQVARSSISTSLTLPLGSRRALDVFASSRRFCAEAFFFEGSDTTQAGPQLSVIGVGGFERISGPAFESLTAQALPPRATTVPYDFGGIFGCIGYDCVSELEPRLKGEARSELVLARRLIVIDHRVGQIHLIDASTRADFRDLKNIIDRAENAAAPAVKPLEISPDRLRAAMGETRYSEGVAQIKEHIKIGDIFQAVLAETFYCETSSPAFAIFSQLRRLSPTPYSFFFAFADGAFFGASPEALVRVQNGRVHSHPIAGTRPRGATAREDLKLRRQLRRSRKEAAEHLMLVDLARNDVGRVAHPGSVEVMDFRVIQNLSNVMHLVSTVEGNLRAGASAIDALKACFPAGTLSGAPKIRAMEILSQLETTPRGLYGGAVIAYDFNGDLEACIAIRSLELRGTTAVLRAGAGIVADSKAPAEYAEVLQKLQPLRQALYAAESETP